MRYLAEYIFTVSFYPICPSPRFVHYDSQTRSTASATHWTLTARSSGVIKGRIVTTSAPDHPLSHSSDLFHLCNVARNLLSDLPTCNHKIQRIHTRAVRNTDDARSHPSDPILPLKTLRFYGPPWPPLPLPQGLESPLPRLCVQCVPPAHRAARSSWP